MRKHPQIVIGVLLIALFICIAITAPLLAPNDPNATNLALKNAPPSAEYPLGCDQMGRCELSRLIYGARYSLSLTVPVLIVLAAIALQMHQILLRILHTPFHTRSLHKNAPCVRTTQT